MDATNLVVLRGVLSRPPVTRELPSGATAIEFDVTTPHEDGARSVPVTFLDPPAVVRRLDAGHEVIVVGHVRRRFFRSGGATQSRTEVVAEGLIRPTRQRDVERLLAPVADALRG
jgi:single-strand DNA-binding protein